MTTSKFCKAIAFGCFTIAAILSFLHAGNVELFVAGGLAIYTLGELI